MCPVNVWETRILSSPRLPISTLTQHYKPGPYFTRWIQNRKTCQKWSVYICLVQWSLIFVPPQPTTEAHGPCSCACVPYPVVKGFWWGKDLKTCCFLDFFRTSPDRCAGRISEWPSAWLKSVTLRGFGTVVCRVEVNASCDKRCSTIRSSAGCCHLHRQSQPFMSNNNIVWKQSVKQT